tara:strand:+ start:1390 stop:1845 length:456 start_codon:yes stop_codon:yes gene_type:complete
VLLVLVLLALLEPLGRLALAQQVLVQQVLAVLGRSGVRLGVAFFISSFVSSFLIYPSGVWPAGVVVTPLGKIHGSGYMLAQSTLDPESSLESRGVFCESSAPWSDHGIYAPSPSRLGALFAGNQRGQFSPAFLGIESNRRRASSSLSLEQP